MRWLEAELPGARAAFSTRAGGVSEAPYESLNVAVKTGDEPGRVARQPAPPGGGAGAGAGERRHGPPGPRGRAAVARRAAGPADIRRGGAEPGGGRRPRNRPAGAGAPGDGRRLPAGRTGRARAASRWPTAAGAAWPAGSSTGRPSAVGAEAAAIGPGIGPCCYEVGDEVLAEFEDLDGVAEGRMLDLPAVARALLERAGVGAVERPTSARSCNPELFYSHRRDGETTGRQAGSPGWRSPWLNLSPNLDPARIRANLERGPRAARARRGDPRGDQVRAARGDGRRSPRPGSPWSGRTASRTWRRSASAGPTRFEWDFIGNLQSRKVKSIVPLVRLIHSVASDSVLEQLEKHAEPDTAVLVEVNLAGEESKGGVEPDALGELHRALPGARRGPDDDAAVHRGPGGLAALFRAPGRAGRRARPGAALDGHQPGLAGRGGGGGDDHPARAVPLRQ